jgi:PHS family inorganic phosphate transporter-like MFS transporter
MFGAVPGLLTIYFRTQITESPRYTAVTAQNVAQAEVDIHNMLEGRPLDEVVDVKVEEVKVIEPILTAREFFWTYKWQLLGTSMCWFFLDIAFYSQTLFQKGFFLKKKIKDTIPYIELNIFRCVCSSWIYSSSY